MAILEVTVQVPESIERLSEKVLGNMGSVYRNAGVHLARCIRNHVRMLAATRHSTAQKLGATPTNHFRASDVPPPISTSSDVTVEVNIPGISRAYQDLDIYPTNAENLTIPLHASSYGVKAKDYPGKLFRIRRKGSAEKGNVLYSNLDGDLTPIYSLVKHVHQVRDPSLMPEDDKMTDEAVQGATDAIMKLLQQ